MRKVLPLKGPKSIRAFTAFNHILLAYKMLPAHLTEDYGEFYEDFKPKSEEEKENILRVALGFIDLTDDEVNTIASFCTDKNGVPFTEVNIGNVDAEELFEILLTVCMEITRIKIHLVSEEEKKRSEILA